MTIGVCPKCQAIHDPLPRCQAHKRSTGVQCGRDAMHEMRTCYVHGSANRRSRDAAARRQLEAEANRALAVQLVDGDPEPVANPLEALSKLAGEALRALLRPLPDDLKAVMSEWIVVLIDHLLAGGSPESFERVALAPLPFRVLLVGPDDQRPSVAAVEARSLPAAASPDLPAADPDPPAAERVVGVTGARYRGDDSDRGHEVQSDRPGPPVGSLEWELRRRGEWREPGGEASSLI